MELADLDPDPLVQFRRWFEDALAAGLHEPAAAVLATTGTDGRPTARHVLLRAFDERGFVFYTNYESRKGQQLDANPAASLVVGWLPIGRQVIVLGDAARTTSEESDVYFASRDRGSQLGAWASEQSRPLPDRRTLDDRYAELDVRYEGRAIPRPPHWGGFRVAPASVEFWQSRTNRLHDRIRYDRDSAHAAWRRVRLNP